MRESKRRMKERTKQKGSFCIHKMRTHTQAFGCLIAILISFLSLESKAWSFVTPFDTVQYANYPFIRFVEPDAPAIVPLSDDEFLDKAGKVVFRVNRFDAFTNDSLLTLLEREVLPMINKDSLKLVRVVVRGAASPEGPYANNRMLGRRRVQTLYDFLRARLTVPVQEDAADIEAVSEDYRLLLAMMRRAGDRDVDLVQRLCDRHLPKDEYTVLKGKLQIVHGGSLWQRLLRDYFPELRAARLVLYFEKANEPNEPDTTTEPNEANEANEVNEPQETDETQETLVPETPALKLRIPRREVLSIKTNVLLDLAYMPGYNRWCPIPNVAIEFYPLKGHFTYGLSFDCPWWQHYDAHKFFQIRNYQVESRYYFKTGRSYKSLAAYRANGVNEANEKPKAAYSGVFLSAYAHAALFGICFDANHGWEGEALGAGIGAGYVLPISKSGHWRLEFAAQVGFLYSGYDPYQYENPVNPAYTDHLYYYKWTGRKADFRERQYRFSWFGPTRVGITLSYDILYRRRAKKGASFRNYEFISPTSPVKIED